MGGLGDLPDAARRTVADFLSVSARATRDSEALVRALRDSLVLSTLDTVGQKEGAGVAASPLN
jgi:hypothetical protein